MAVGATAPHLLYSSCARHRDEAPTLVSTPTLALALTLTRHAGLHLLSFSPSAHPLTRRSAAPAAALRPRVPDAAPPTADGGGRAPPARAARLLHVTPHGASSRVPADAADAASAGEGGAASQPSLAVSETVRVSSFVLPEWLCDEALLEAASSSAAQPGP